MEENSVIVPNIHLHSEPLDDRVKLKVDELRLEIQNDTLYQEYKDFCSDQQLQRFLAARQYKIAEAKDLTLGSLKWRSGRVSPAGIYGYDDWETRFGKECECGKIWIPGADRHGRPVLVMDNSVNVNPSVDEIQTFLTWSIELACELMPSNIDKYVVFMNLQAFSLFNCPPMRSCTETVFMFCNGYPERLGHLIVYKPSFFLNTVYSAVKYLIDPKTATKIHFIAGKPLKLLEYISY